jgi:PAS domain S-box-containing protein
MAGLLALALALPAGAVGDASGLAQLGIERWGTEAGLGSDWVRDIVEGPDGFIWVATANGLSRFDGRAFSNFSPANSPGLPHSGISALATGAGGRLWIGLEFGGLRSLDGGTIHEVHTTPALDAAVSVRALLEDRAGVLWVGTAKGLWRVAGGVAAKVAPDPSALNAEINAVVKAANGELWVRSAEHGLWRVVDGAPVAVADPPGCRGYGLALGSDGALFTSCREGVWQWLPATSEWRMISNEFGAGRLFLDRRGDLWFGARDGLKRWSGGAMSTRSPDRGLGDWRVRASFEDSRGDLWVGTFSGGLARLRHGPVRAFGADEGLPINGTTAVLATADGGAWVGALGMGLLKWHPSLGVLQRWGIGEGLPDATAWAVAEDPAATNGLWVGTDGGLAWIEAGRVHDSGPGGIAYRGSVHLIYVDRAAPGTLWVAGAAGGVVELRALQQTVHDAGNGLALDHVRFLLRDRAGRLIAGGDEGLFQYDSARWTRWRPAGHALRALTAFAEQADGGLWLASSVDGLVHWVDGQYSAYGLRDGLPFWPIHSVEADHAGGLWISGNEGLARIRLDDHERWRRGEIAAIPFEKLGRRDGLRDAECNGWGSPASTRMADGRLVYPTISGVALVDTRLASSVELSPAEIYVDAASSGSRALALDRPLQLDATERSLRVGFSAIELLHPEAVSFRYRLDGYDPDWVPASRVTEATYAHLLPGDYRFELQARLPGRDWVGSAQALEVVVQPQAWETLGFRVAIAAALLVLGLALLRWRLAVDQRHAAVLRRARTFLREVIDTSPNPIFARRRDGTYSLANRAAAAIYGLQPEAVEGRTPEQLGPELEGMARLEALDAEVIETGTERVVQEDTIVDHEGRMHWFRMVKRPGFSADGQSVEQVIGTAVDVTDFKLAEMRLQREESKLRRSREEARRLSRQLLRAQEDERRRLAREMHDDVTQRLAGLAMLAWGTSRAVARDPAHDVRRAVEEIAGELERIANEVQALSRELHPPALEGLGLSDTLRAECNTFANRTGLAVGFERSGNFADPPAEVGLALYRIVQEALRNCIAHSGASMVAVRLDGSARQIRLVIEDHGAGFDPAAPGARPGLGLSSMRERAHLAGAALVLDSAPGRGTRIVVIVPVAANEDVEPVGQRRQ